MKRLRLGLAAGLFLAAMTPSAMASMDPFIGEVMVVGFNYCPQGWLPADGRTLPIAQNQALFALLGTTFGGDGKTSFALPDLRGRVIVGSGPTNPLGQQTNAAVNEDKAAGQTGVAMTVCIAVNGIWPQRQ